MKILFFLKYSRDQASSRVRGFYMAEELKRRGINCFIVYGYNKKAYIHFLLNLMRCNIVYFQKRYSTIDFKLNKLARFMGKKTIFDIDDAPGGVSLNSAAEKMAIQMMKYSSVVVVGSHKLMNFAKKFNRFIYLIPSSINLNYYKPKREKKDKDYITLGWIGNGINYKKDLLMLTKSLEEISKKHKLKLSIVGAMGQKEIYESFGKLKSMVIKIIDSIDWADPFAAPKTISDFDIGLYPLIDNEYNQYKCGGKLLEYMAMGVPTVVSPIGENKFIIENKIDGFLVSDEKGWIEKLFCLVKNESIREKMGNIARKKIEEKYSTKVCADKLIKIFKKM